MGLSTLGQYLWAATWAEKYKCTVPSVYLKPPPEDVWVLLPEAPPCSWCSAASSQWVLSLTVQGVCTPCIQDTLKTLRPLGSVVRILNGRNVNWPVNLLHTNWTTSPAAYLACSPRGMQLVH